MVPDQRETQSSPTNRLLLLDGHSLAYRAFYALPVENFSTTTGQHTNAVYGFVAMLINLLRDEKPTHVAVAFDVGRQTFRSQAYPQYKANRAASPEAFTGQIALIKEVLAALAIPTLELADYEADDIIATLTHQAREQGFAVLITSGDRDTFQLVDQTVTVLYPKRGVSELARMTPQAVQERYGLTPAQYPDFAALRGDPSDNLPSIPGVGEKTATKWIVDFGSLQALLDNAEQVKGKAGGLLREHVEQVRTNRTLTQLVTDVALPLGVADTAVRSWDREAVHRIFDALEFRVLRDRLYATLETAQPEAEQGFQVSVDQLPAGQLAGWLEHTSQVKSSASEQDDEQVHPTGLSFLGQWGRGHGEITGLALARSDGATIFVQPATLEPRDHSALVAWLADASRPKAAHDLKGPLHALTDSGLITRAHLAGVWCDTALAAYVARPDQRSYGLGDLVLRYLNRSLEVHSQPVSPTPAHQQLSLDMGDQQPAPVQAHDQQVAQLAALSAHAVAELAQALMADLHASGQQQLMRQVELPLVAVLAGMEQAGIAIDLDMLHELDAHFAAEVATAATNAYEVIGKKINLGSPKQLQVVLFDELHMPKTKRTKTGYTTDADALQSLFAQTQHPFVQHLLHHRDATRMKVTVEGLLKSVSDDGRIHTTYNQTIAATGRLSSNDPNLQNIPIRTEQGRRIRQTFVVGPGFETLMTADYSQIEMRIMAHLSQDQALIDAFNSGEDLHTSVASRVFAVPPGQVDATMRSRIKAMSYGLAYGLSNYGLSQQLGISPVEAQGLMDEYFQRFGGIRDYLHGVVELARRTGYTATVLGRRRYLPDLTSDNRQRREIAERMALNAPIQGSAADIIKLAMLHTDAALRQQRLASRVLLQVHDELVVEVAPGERDATQKLIIETMGSAWPLEVPLTVSVGFGHSWHEAAH